MKKRTSSKGPGVLYAPNTPVGASGSSEKGSFTNDHDPDGDPIFDMKARIDACRRIVRGWGTG